MESKELVKKELKAMRHKAFRVRAVLTTIARKKWNVGFLNLHPADELRLITFWVWSQRYKVPLSYVMETVIGWWKQVTSKRKGRKAALGVRVVTLTTKKSEAILQECILRDFPNNENVAEWRLHKQEKLLGLLDEPRGLARAFVDLRYPDKTVRSYKRKVDRRRYKLMKANAAQWRRRRAWRGNPWRR